MPNDYSIWPYSYRHYLKQKQEQQTKLLSEVKKNKFVAGSTHCVPNIYPCRILISF